MNVAPLKQSHGWWFPQAETHLIGWLDKAGKVIDGRTAYQWKKLERALALCSGFRRAIDIGAHVGLWTYYLAGRFAAVESFEPVLLHRQCFARNIRGDRVILYPYALGAAPRRVAMITEPTSSGDTRVGGEGDIPLERLDDLLPDLDDVDFIKLDCEGSELPALQGAEAILLRCRPTICVEQKPGHARRFGLPDQGAVAWLQARGWVLRDELAGDFILTGR